MRITQKYWYVAAFFVVLALATFFRFWQLSDIPPGVYPDEAKYANDALTTLETGDWKLFYPENNGREGLYMWLLATVFYLFGKSIFTLKLVSAVGGVLAVWGTYLLTREVFYYSARHEDQPSPTNLHPIGREAVALLAAGLMATSFWHINFSRIAFRATMVPLFLAFGLYLTLRAIRTKSMWSVVAAALVWGGGFYTYLAFRMALLIPILMTGFAFLASLAHVRYVNGRIEYQDKAFWRRLFFQNKWWQMVVLLALMMLVMSPLLLHFYAHPEDFISRSTGISIFETKSPPYALLRSLGLHIQMLFWEGDSNWRHNFSGEPQLALPVGLLFLAGVFYSFMNMREGVKSHNWDAVTVHLSLWASFGLMLLPAALTVEAIPHALRAIGLMPLVFVFAAFGFLFCIRLLFPIKHQRDEIWPFGFGAVMVIILLMASFQFQHYFFDWAKRPEVAGAFAKDYVEIGRYFNGLPETIHKYLIINGNGGDVSYPKQILLPSSQKLPMPGQTTLLIQRFDGGTLTNTTYLRKDELPPLSEETSVFVPLNPSDDIKKQLHETYPGGVEERVQSFWVYLIH